MIRHLHHHVEAEGRDPADIDIAFTTGLPGPADGGFRPDAHLQALEAMAAEGVTWISVPVPGDSLPRALEALSRYGDEVIARDRT